MNSVKTIRKQQGAVLVLTALSLFVLMGAAGLAIDIGHTMVEKTIQQNAVDSMTLSAAIRLHQENDPANDDDEVAAIAAGKATYDLFKASQGNAEISSGLANGDFTFTFSNTTDLSASPIWNEASFFDSSGNNPNFVRVNSAAMNIHTWFAGIIGFRQFAASSSAVAGYTPIAPCQLAPIMMCADPTISKPYPPCSATNPNCYGYKLNNIYCLTQGQGNFPETNPPKCEASAAPIDELGPGNIGFVNLGKIFNINNGAQFLGECLAQDAQCQFYDPQYCSGSLYAEPGGNVGMVRFGIESLFYDTNQPQFSSYPPDTITGLGPLQGTKYAGRPIDTNGTNPCSGSTCSSQTYLDWNTIQSMGYSSIPATGLDPTSSNFINNGIPSPISVYKTFQSQIEKGLPASSQYKKRVLPVAFVDCTQAAGGASAPYPVVGYGCFLLTAEVQDGAGSENFILGQFINDPDVCQSTGISISVGNFGFEKVIEYKDPKGGHS